MARAQIRSVAFAANLNSWAEGLMRAVSSAAILSVVGIVYAPNLASADEGGVSFGCQGFLAVWRRCPDSPDGHLPPLAIIPA